ncbi:TonB-dependent receptor [Sphingopyxis sp. R3-92]|uniref:TonB-dependent receptor n=1 Tax=Sphingopyxis sp. R3-92 TaxID=3158553 RepID=UPI003EE5E77C
MEERIIDVPISVSAFTMEQLADQKIETGAELLRAIPNVNFSKDNFTSYNFSIRGIGTKATSVSADPAVAISFNNTTLLRNRLFEQEYFDIERLEVLRGPQGTLYGRNATAGVVNMIPAKAKLGRFDGELQGEVGNFGSTRLRGMINVPLGDNFAIRGAGAWTKREGFDRNTVTGRRVNGRDLWSTRLSATWEPSDNFRVNAVWEHFNEDDNRSRTGKQLCTRGATPGKFQYPSGFTDTDNPNDPNNDPSVDPVNFDPNSAPLFDVWAASTLTPGCQAKSLFTDEAFGVPNGLGFPVVTGMLLVRAGFGSPSDYPSNLYADPVLDPFRVAGDRQSPDLRTISTTYDPVFRAKNDIFQLNLEFDPSDTLHLTSQTLYMKDNYYGSQDFFRFDAEPIFARRESFNFFIKPNYAPFLGPSTERGGVFCDPQLGCSDRPLAVDISRSKSKQWSQEVRLQSSFDGPLNFSVGANYVDFKTQEEYNVYSNLLTLIALGVNDFAGVNCDAAGRETAVECIYIDPNPIGEGPQDGHNYLRSISIAKIRSAATFGEVYWKATDNLKFTAGLRYTDDKKTLTPIPTQLLAAATPFGGGTVNRGYPAEPDRVQRWKRFTGRFAVDWKPELSFTDNTLVYASYSRGYKAGGANPRGNDVNPDFANYTHLADTFAPEDVNAFEIGTKNQFAGGKLMISAAAFLNDYKNYQISQLIDRSFHTENVDARTMGLELEAAWLPSRNFRIGGTLGYLNTKIGKGQYSIDVMDRLQGNDDWVVLRPWAQSPNTCVAPREVISRFLNSDLYKSGNPSPPAGWKPGDAPVFSDGVGLFMRLLCESPNFIEGRFDPGSQYSQEANLVYNPTAPYDPTKASSYDPANPFNYGGPNGGRGFSANIGGNELPNAPRFTFNIGAQYTFFMNDWELAFRGDYYRQSSSYARIYNTEYDKLKGWGNGNIAVTLSRPKSDLAFQLYVKNILNSTPITDSYTGPDELGNFANVFTLDPRIYGFSVKFGF